MNQPIPPTYARHRRLGLLFIAVVMATGLAQVAWRALVPSDGLVMVRHLSRISTQQPRGVVEEPPPADQPGILQGDQVIAIDGRSFEAWMQPGYTQFWQLNQRVPYTVLRKGQQIETHVTMRIYMRNALTEHFVQSLPTLVFSVVSLTVGLFVFFKRPAEYAAWALLAYGLGIASYHIQEWFGPRVSDFTNKFVLYGSVAVLLYSFLMAYISGMQTTLGLPRPPRHPGWLARHFRTVSLSLYALPILVITGVGINEVVLHPMLPYTFTDISAFVVAISASIARFSIPFIRLKREALPTERVWLRQLFALNLFVTVTNVLLTIVPKAIFGEHIGTVASTLLVLPFPIGVAVIILRYRVLDIDLIINRALVYGTLTTGVVALYVLTVIGLGSILGSSANTILSLGVTGVVAVLFQPARERVQRGINRIMYGERDSPYRVLTTVAQSTHKSRTPHDALQAVAQTTTSLLKLPYLQISLRSIDSATLRDVATIGQSSSPQTALNRFPLSYQGNPIGELVVASRGADELLSPQDRQVLQDVAQHTGVIAYAALLSDDLQRSRERLVTAREEERRILHRNLHDGLGPVLTSLVWELDSVRDALTHQPIQADEMLSQVRLRMQETISDVRRLVYNLRPPALDQLGLLAAIREFAARPVGAAQPRIQVVAPDKLPTLSAAIEVAAYRIAQEALNNAWRHAQPRTVEVQFTTRANELMLTITDDGIGLPENAQRGVGLSSMRERAEELGGKFAISRRETGGTLVAASLPIFVQ